jgi:hypothetical protein
VTLRPTRAELVLAAHAYHHGRHDQHRTTGAGRVLPFTVWCAAVDRALTARPGLGVADLTALYDQTLAEHAKPVQKLIDVPLPLEVR